MYDNFPTPFTITVDRLHGDDDDGRPLFRATSAEYPRLSASSQDGQAAVSCLMDDIVEALRDIEDQVPLGAAMVDALRAAGHSDEAIHAWDWCMVGDLRHFRYNPEDALDILEEFASQGIPAALALRFILTGVTVDEAKQIHSAGRAPEDVLPYRRWSATDRWYRWDFDYVEWMLAGVPAERCMMYSGRCSSAEAVEWEAAAAGHNISQEDIADILRARFTLEDFVNGVEEYAGTDVTVADAARMKLALTQPLRWPHGYDEPPF